MARPRRHRLAAASVAAALAGVAGGAAALTISAVPAAAANQSQAGPPFATISDPKPNSIQKTGTPTIDGTVSTPTPYGQIMSMQITITITPKGGQPTPNTFSIKAQPPGSGQQQDPWMFSAPVPSQSSLALDNGPYSVTAVATESDNGPSHQGQQSPPVDFAEGVAPQAPTGVSAVKNADGSGDTVSWQANPEHDIVGYEVQRASVNGSDWTTVSPSSNGTDTNYRDTSVQPGTDYQYQVIAVRKGAQSGQTISSPPSAIASTVAAAGGPLFGPGGSVPELPLAVQAITDPVAGQVHPGHGPGGPVTGSPTAGGYGNLSYNGGQASLAEPGTPGAQDPKGRSAAANLLRTALFVAAALILLAIAAHLIRMRRALDDDMQPVGVDSWDRHAAGMAETAEVATVDTKRRRSDITRTMAAPRGDEHGAPITRAMRAQRDDDDRSAIARAMTAQRRR
jgi:hypothetical protein